MPVRADPPPAGFAFGLAKVQAELRSLLATIGTDTILDEALLPFRASPKGTP